MNNQIFKSKQALGRNDFTEAIHLLNGVIPIRPDLYEPFFLRAVARYNLGDYKGAEQDLTSALNIKPNFPDALLYRGVSRERLMNFHDAINDFDRALRLEPFNDNILVSKAFTKTHLEEHQQAIELCNQAIRINKKNERAFLCRAWNRYQTYDLEEAIRDYTRALKINQFNSDTYTKRGMTYAFQLKYDDALKDLDKALELDSLNLHAMFQLAHIYREMDQPDRAMNQYSRMINIDPASAMAYFERGNLLAETGDKDGAIEDFTMVIVLTGGHMITYFNRGSMYFDKGKYSAAVEDLSKAIEIYPGMAEAYFNRAMAYSRMGLNHKAQKDMDRAREIKSEMYALSGIEQAEELSKIRELATIREDFQGSDTRFGRIQNKRTEIRPAPDFFIVPEPWVPDSLKSEALYLGILTRMTSSTRPMVAMSHPGWMLDRAEERQERLNRDLAENPDNRMALIQQGILFQLLENYELALEVYDAVLSEEPDHTIALLNRSYVLHRMLFLTDALEASFSEKHKPDEAGSVIAGDYHQLAGNLERIIVLKPEFIPARFNLANLYASMGDHRSAVKTYRDIIELVPNLGAIHFNLALTLLYLNNRDDACKHLSSAGENGYQPSFAVMKRYCR